jgi:signal transduction histidine kinase
MFGVYCAIVFAVSLHTSSLSAVVFGSATAVLAIAVEFDSVPSRGLDGFVWASINRLCAIAFALGCGMALRQLRKEIGQKIEALEHAGNLERELLEVAEREQKRIGQDLHDGVCQTLAALNCAAHCLELDLTTDGSQRLDIATALQKGLSEATLEVRNIARGIYPVWREGETIETALEALVKRTNLLCRASVSFSCKGTVRSIAPATAMHLYRITQEALQNAMRHSNATQIEVDVNTTDDELVIAVCDNGCGSTLQPKPDGMGWRTMRYRANLIGAAIQVKAVSKEGTTVYCTLPLPSKNNPTNGAPPRFAPS